MGVSSKSVLPILIVFAILSVFCGNCADCMPGVKTMGYTMPKGDITVRYGDPLEIYCTLNERNAQKYGPNASQYLIFQRNKDTLPQEMVQVINSTTIKLHVDKPAKAGQENYMCIFKKGKLKISVCMNFVYIGVAPQEIKDFSCISRNLDNLTCTWTPPKNYVTTDYELSYTSSVAANMDNAFYCPKIEVSSVMSCTWSVSTQPIYRQSVRDFYFTLKANNTFGTYTMGKKHFRHFEHVIPNPPENLQYHGKSWNSVNLSWTVPTALQTFPPGLNHRIKYQSAYGKKEWQTRPIFTTKEVREVHFQLDNLEYAHAYYDIRVSLGSALADSNNESLWSEYAFVNVLTASKKPDRPPRTNIGSFEVLTYGNNSDRNVRIYWSHIPKEERNGENFSYVVAIKGQEDDPRTTESSFYFYEGLSPHKSYTFHIWAKNEMGYSDEKAIVKVPILEDSARQPIALRKVVLGRGHYRLFWNHLEVNHEIKNYTIFWCDDDRDPPPCRGTLEWVVVPGTETSYNQSIPSNKTYQFAISANTDHGSSGMTWTQCTSLYYKDSVPKITAFWRHNVGSNFVHVKWILSCPDKSVTGFIIYHCPIVGPANSTCKESEKNLTVPSNETSALVVNVAPYTTYRMQVAAIINHTSYGQRSEKVLSTTLEAAPSTPPTHLNVLKVTNSSIEISWKAPSETNGMLKYYRIFWNNKTKQVNPEPGVDIQSANLTNLTSYKMYYITVQACTVVCSAHSETLQVQTEIGHPGVIRKPFMTQNSTYTLISWDGPEEPNGRIERYELRLKEKLDKENATTIFNATGQQWGIQSCGKEKKYNSFFVSVRAVNIDKDKVYHGNWSDEVESYCRSPSNYVIYILVPGTILFLLAMTYFFKKIYSHFQAMRDVGVKLPQGLQGEGAGTDITLSNWTQKPRIEDGNRPAADDEEQLLMKKSEGSPILNCGDSSGCSSAHESVTCSVDTASNISSSDSGTEQPRTPSPEELSAATSLRQRNIRPPSFTKPYVVLPLDPSNANLSKISPKSYCVLGVDPNINAEGSSSYISLSSMNEKPIYNPSDSPLSPPYVLTGELVKTTNPGYVPYKPSLITESASRNPSYVVAGNKDVLSTDVSPVEQSIAVQDSAYIKIADNLSLKNADLSSWQPTSLSTNAKTGYVGFGEVPHAKKEAKGYVPHRQFESKALKED